jgi:TolB-like protein/tetratricopeptide (TPR) repeat protein
MELLEGQTLREELSAGPLAPQDALQVAVQVARGLAAAHDKGIVHRDLKPENLFLLPDRRVKILDFGLARILPPPAAHDDATVSAVTEPGTLLGTAAYMAPEQVRGEPADHRADLFALGAVLYEMLAGRRAFTGSTAEVLASIVGRDPPPLPADLPSALARVVGRCLEKQPDRRFRSAHDLSLALEAVEGAVRAGAAAVPASPPSAARRPLAWGAVALLVLAGVVAWRAGRQPSGGSSGPTIRSLAVLPLANHSQDPAQEYFVDGMTEALIGSLAHLRDVKVISRTSVMRFKGTTLALADVARQLGVDAVVEGSVLRAGERVRISAQLVDARADRHLWSRSYEGDVRDVLALQDDVARAVAAEVETTIALAQAPPAPVDPAAQEEYLQGRFHWNKRTPESIRRADEHFRRAIERDPGFAPAHAGRADCFLMLAVHPVGEIPPREGMSRASEFARRALELAPALAEAHASLAYALHLQLEWPASEREFQRCLTLNPNYATGRFWHAAHLAARGRFEEAIAEASRGRELDPVSPIINAGLSWMYHFARRDAEAADQARRVLELDPGFAIGHSRLGIALKRLGRHAEAVAEFREAARLSGDAPDLVAGLAGAYAAAGRAPEAERLLGELEGVAKRRYVSAYSRALVYGELGRRDQAFAWLEKAVGERHGNLAYLATEPDFDPLRGDPRFAGVLRRLGLEGGY